MSSMAALLHSTHIVVSKTIHPVLPLTTVRLAMS